MNKLVAQTLVEFANESFTIGHLDVVVGRAVEARVATVPHISASCGEDFFSVFENLKLGSGVFGTASTKMIRL